jgi:signal transduction histidine kinase
LSDALAALGSELTGSSNEPVPSYQVIVEGRPRDLAPLVRDEIYRIAREAFRNAVRHGQAKHIEAEIEYAEAALRLRIRDDGLGIDKEVLRAGRREGHWGLDGMRERAAGLNGRFAVWSEVGAGTEVEVQVPAAVAYSKRSSASRTQRE